MTTPRIRVHKDMGKYTHCLQGIMYSSYLVFVLFFRNNPKNIGIITTEEKFSPGVYRMHVMRQKAHDHCLSVLTWRPEGERKLIGQEQRGEP